MADFSKRIFWLIFPLVLLLVGLPFFHYHPGNSHTHHSELSPHTHQGHFHSNELSGFVELIHHDSANPWQEGEHHSHSDADTGANYFDFNLLKSNGNPVKSFKISKSGNVQKLFIAFEPTRVHFQPPDRITFESSGIADSPKERSPPFSFV